MTAASTDGAKEGDRILGRTVLGNYVVEKKLGEGGMGTVYRLKHTRLPNTWAALKVLAAGESQHMRERFEQEALVASAVGSHRVARPIDLGCFDDGAAYIVMEYVPGRSLAEELAEYGPLDVSTALRVACRVADTLAVAHEVGIVHRDVKPSNIMLVRQGDEDAAVKLLDFGVARAPGELKLATTGRAALIGTPGYMAPESITGAEIDGRVDVFALGVVLFEMLAGRPPFCGPSVEQVLASALAEPAPPIALARPVDLDPVDATIEALVARALAKKPSERCTMLELQRALTAALVERAQRLPSTLRPSGQTPEARAALAVDVEEVLDRVQASSSPARTAGSGTIADAAPIVRTAPPKKRRRWIAATLALAVSSVVAIAIVMRRHATPAPSIVIASTPPPPTPPSTTRIDSPPPPTPVVLAQPAPVAPAPVAPAPVAPVSARVPRRGGSRSVAHSHAPSNGGGDDEDELK